MGNGHHKPEVTYPLVLCGESLLSYPFGEMSIPKTLLRWLSSNITHFPDLRSHIRPHPSIPLYIIQTLYIIEVYCNDDPLP